MPRGGFREGGGGKQPGAGRPRQRLTLDKVAAKELHLLKLQQPGHLTEEQIVANLIRQAWIELDHAYDTAAAHDPGSA